MKRLYLSLIVLMLALQSFAGIIKPSNVVDISVQGHPELSGRYTVADDGTIGYSFLTDQSITNITTAELQNDITIKLARYVENPLVLVTLVDKPEISVTVLGQVVKPGPVKVYAGASVQEVIALAGGPLPTADYDSVKIIRRNGSDNTALWFDMKEFMRTGSMDNMPKLQQDDVVILLAQVKVNKVKVIGGVNKPGFYDVTEKMNLFEMIYLAGGPAEKADLAHVRHVFHVGDKTKEEVVNVQSYIDKGNMDQLPKIEEGDTIIIYTKWFDWRTFMSVLTNALLFIVTITSLRNALVPK